MIKFLSMLKGLSFIATKINSFKHGFTYKINESVAFFL